MPIHGRGDKHDAALALLTAREWVKRTEAAAACSVPAHTPYVHEHVCNASSFFCRLPPPSMVQRCKSILGGLHVNTCKLPSNPQCWQGSRLRNSNKATPSHFSMHIQNLQYFPLWNTTNVGSFWKNMFLPWLCNASFGPKYNEELLQIIKTFGKHNQLLKLLFKVAVLQIEHKIQTKLSFKSVMSAIIKYCNLWLLSKHTRCAGHLELTFKDNKQLLAN